ncbi:MAG: efflux RND transporter periplasmic adaptor subunit [Bacteroidales bacterium]|nr:efflux RND transporter periplasmic adaptor subunit [Bacteroidales bacterium]
MKKLLSFAIPVIFTAAFVSCNQMGSSENETPVNDASAIVNPVKTMKVEYNTIQRTVKLSANLEAEEETYLAPGISGIIRSIDVDVNDRVKKGQVLVRMDKSQLSQTRVQYENLKKDLARMDTLIQYGTISQQSYDQMKTQVEVTGVMLENLEENTTLRAPYNAVITGKYFNDGELFSPAPNTPAGKAAIVSLVKMDVLKVFINLSETYLPLVKKSLTAKVRTEVYPKDVSEAKVHRIYPTINAATRTFTVELRMKNPDYLLRPGMYSVVTLELGDRDALLIPAITVQKQPGTNNRYVFIEKNGTANKIQVTLGERLDDKLEILENGVKEGDQLIYAGHVNLMDGDKVKVVN